MDFINFLVFQWTWIAANNWGSCHTGGRGMGCGPQVGDTIEMLLNMLNVFCDCRRHLGLVQMCLYQVLLMEIKNISWTKWLV